MFQSAGRVWICFVQLCKNGLHARGVCASAQRAAAVFPRATNRLAIRGPRLGRSLNVTGWFLLVLRHEAKNYNTGVLYGDLNALPECDVVFDLGSRSPNPDQT